MSAGRRIELNPGEWFMIAEKAIHVHFYESVFAMTRVIGTDASDQLAYILTFAGRINNSDETDTVTVMLSPQDAWNLVSAMLNQFDELHKHMKE